MDNVPAVVRRYLQSGDALTRAQLLREYPELAAELESDAVRQAILVWLSDEAAWRGDAERLVENCIEFLTARATADEAGVIRPFALHSNPHIRLRSFEFLLSLHFADHNQEALIVVLQSMLADQSEIVRREAAAFIEKTGVLGELRPFLLRWRAQAVERGLAETESFELVDRLLVQ